MLRNHQYFEKYYEPRMVAIGPFHHNKPSCHMGEKFKLALAAKYIKASGRQAKDLHKIIEDNIDTLKDRYDEEATRSVGVLYNALGCDEGVAQLFSEIELEDKRAIFWIQGHGVPREMIIPNNGRKLGNMIGSVLEVEDPKKDGDRGFIRMRVDFDTRKPLATFVNLPRPDMAPTKIYLKYEKLMSFCYNCGRLGHMEGACTFRVHPTLLKLGVVYDRNLVAESLQKPVFTQGTFPTEHPYIPTTGIFKRGNTRGKIQISNSREGESQDRDISATAQRSGNESGPSNLRVRVPLDHVTKSDRLRLPRFADNGPNIFDPEAHGVVFRNGSLTRALGGLTIRNEYWAELERLPPRAFSNKEEYLNEKTWLPCPMQKDTEDTPVLSKSKQYAAHIEEIPDSTCQRSQVFMAADYIGGRGCSILGGQVVSTDGVEQVEINVYSPHSLGSVKRKRQAKVPFDPSTPGKRSKAAQGTSVRSIGSRGRGRGRGSRGGRVKGKGGLGDNSNHTSDHDRVCPPQVFGLLVMELAAFVAEVMIYHLYVHAVF
ncbi:hypothetical protein ACLB2K_000460 [Fragaria x ananassa]